MRLVLLVTGCLAWVASPATSDWIATRAGHVIVTDGSWEQRDRIVVFEGQDGGLYSLLSSEIDWAATAYINLHPARRAVDRFVAANALEIADQTTLRWVVGALVHGLRAQQRTSAGSARSVGPPLVLTDSDVAHVAPKVALPPELFPIAWRRSFDVRPGELAITGELTNRSELILSGVDLELRLLDAAGRSLESVELHPAPAIVAPGERAVFQVLPRAADFRKVEFSARGRLSGATP